MSRRSKSLVKFRSKPHRKSVKATQRKKARARVRGFHPASVRRRKRSLRKKKR